MNARRIGYMDGYTEKTAANALSTAAGLVAGTGKTVGELAAATLPYLLLAPPALGVGAGLLHSKLTSPSSMDREAVQQALEAAELEEFEAEILRKTADEAEKEKVKQLEKESPVERPLHI